MEMKELFEVIKANGFDFGEYLDGEQKIMKPELEALGYTEITFRTGEKDSFGPLSRIVTAKDSNGNTVQFVYG